MTNLKYYKIWREKKLAAKVSQNRKSTRQLSNQNRSKTRKIGENLGKFIMMTTVPISAHYTRKTIKYTYRMKIGFKKHVECLDHVSAYNDG
jgi:hypothetical protein